MMECLKLVKSLMETTAGWTDLGECLKLVEVFDGAEQLETDTGGDDEETSGEENKTAQLLAWTKYLQRTSLLHHTPKITF